MTLHQYLSKRGMTASAFAARLDVPPSTITRLLHGSTPTVQTIRKVETETRGRVKYNDWIGETEE